MFGNLSDIIKIPAAIIIGMVLASIVLLVSYEGIRLPLIGQIVNGRVQNSVDAAKATMVTTFERDTLAAQLSEERRRAQEATQITEEYRKRTDAALRDKADAESKLEKAIAEDTATDSPNWSAGDMLWLCQHGQARYCSR